MAGLDRAYSSNTPIVNGDNDAEGNFDRLTVLQDVAHSDLSAKAYFAEELVPSDGNPAAVTTAIDEILGIRNYGGLSSDGVANAAGSANLLLSALVRKAVQADEATARIAFSDTVHHTSPAIESAVSGETPQTLARSGYYKTPPEGGPDPLPTPVPTPGPTPGPTPSPTSGPGPVDPPSNTPHPIVDLDLGINTRDPSISLGLVIDPTGTTLLDLDATVETIANTSASLAATVDTLIQGTTQITANVASDLVNGLHGTVGNVINLVTGTGGTTPIISLNTANNLLSDPGGILSKTTLGIDLSGDTLLDVNATVHTVANTAASLHAKVDTLLSGGDIVPNAVTELSTLLTSLPALQPGSSEGPILSIDSATDLLCDPTKIMTDLTLGIDPGGSTLLDVGATLDTVADTAAGIQGVVENLTSGADITTDLTSALAQTLGGPGEAGLPDINPGSDDAPIISLQSANNLLEDPTSEITDTLLVINPNGNTLLDTNATLDTIADTSADAQVLLENLISGGDVVAAVTSQLDDMLGLSTQSPPDAGALVEAVTDGLANADTIADSIADVGIGEDPAAVVTEGVTHLLNAALDPQPGNGGETPVISAESINNVLSDPTGEITDTVITVIPGGDTLLEANAALDTVADIAADTQAAVENLAGTPDIVATFTSALQDMPDTLSGDTGDMLPDVQGMEETLANVAGGVTEFLADPASIVPQGDPVGLMPDDPAVIVQQLVETVTGSDDIINTVTNELAELLGAQTWQGGNGETITNIDTISDILSGPASLFCDTDINIDPAGDTLLEANAALDTVADIAADTQAAVENLAGTPDIVATLTSAFQDMPDTLSGDTGGMLPDVQGVEETLANVAGGVTEFLADPASIVPQGDPVGLMPDDPAVIVQQLVETITGNGDIASAVTHELTELLTPQTGQGGANDAPIINVDTVSDVLSNPASLFFDTDTVTIDQAGTALTDVNTALDTVADTVAQVQMAAESLVSAPDSLAALTGGIDELLGAFADPSGNLSDDPAANVQSLMLGITGSTGTETTDSITDTVADITVQVQAAAENLTTLPVQDSAVSGNALSSLSAIENVASAPENLLDTVTSAVIEPVVDVTPVVSDAVTSSLSSLESLTATITDTTQVTSPDPAIMTTLMDNTLHDTTSDTASSGAASYDINHVLDAVVATATGTTGSSSSSDASGGTGSTSSGSAGSSWTEQVVQPVTTATQTTTSVLNATVPVVDTTVQTTTTSVLTKLKKLF